MKIRVLSYNIHKGFSVFNTELILSRIKKTIDLVHADIVFLQEVVGEHHGHEQHRLEWPKVPQFEYLADKAWSHYAYGKNAVYDEGHHGNAILSKFPIKAWHNTDVSTNAFEQRGFLHAQIEIPESGKSIHLFCLHLSLFESGRLKQVDQLIRKIQCEIPDEAPVIVAGDFNDWTAKCSNHLEGGLGLKEAYKSKYGNYAKTFPAVWPILRLDRVFARGLSVNEAQVLSGPPWSELSDHLALEVEFEF